VRVNSNGGYVMRAYALLTGVLFALIACAHVLRLVFGWPVQMAGLAVPMWVSWFGILGAGVLAVWAALIYRGRR
jgi:hypothetical protein